MSIRSFYPKSFFDKKQSKTLLIVLAIFWVILLPYFTFAIKSAWFFMVIWLLIGTYQLVGILYALKNGLYRKKGEKHKKPRRVPPEEFLAKVIKDVKHGKHE